MYWFFLSLLFFVDWVMVRTKNGGNLVGRDDFVEELLDEDEDGY